MDRASRTTRIPDRRVLRAGLTTVGLVGVSLALAACGASPVASSSASTTSTQANTSSTPSGPGAIGFGSVPSGFSPSSGSFISSNDTFVLGGVKCASARTGYCAELAKSTDKGQSWVAVPMNGINLVPRFSTSPSSASYTGVSQVRFAGTSIGFAFDPGLWVTTDGGATWIQASVKGLASVGTSYAVTSLEIANGNAGAIVAPRTGSGATYLITANLATAPTAFRLQSVPMTLGVGSIFFQNSLGKLITDAAASSGSTFFQPAGTSTWDGISPPCTANNAGAPNISAVGSLFNPGTAPDGLVMGCNLGAAAGSSQKAVNVSSNAGATWKVLGAPPMAGDLQAVAAGSAKNVAVAAVSGASFIYTTTNGGATWSTFRFGNNPLGAGGIPLFDLGYTNATQAFVIIGSPGDTANGTTPSAMYLTTNAGSTWSEINF